MSERPVKLSFKNIEPATFPLPDRADTFPRPLTPETTAQLYKRYTFGKRQAAAATEALFGVGELAEYKPTITAQDWSEMYDWLARWRYDEAMEQQSGQFGTNVAWDVQLTVAPITGNLPNHDVLGDAAWLRADAMWNEYRKEWSGGKETPSSIIMDQARAWAQDRFLNEAVDSDTLQNVVQLPDGRQINANFIVRGNTMLRRGQDRAALRGGDTIKFYSDPDNMIVVTGADKDREIIFDAAIEHLANQRPGIVNQETLKAWADCAYMLYQAPVMKRGSDAVIRSLLTIAGSYMFGETPVISHDIDLRAYVCGQDAFIQHVLDQQSLR